MHNPKVRFTLKFSLVTQLLFFVFGFSPLPAKAQNPDTLLAVWQSVDAPDSVRAKSYRTYIRNVLLFKYPDSAYQKGLELIEFSQANELPTHHAAGLNILGISASIRNDYNGATIHFENALEIYQNINDSVESVGTLINLGNNARSADNYFKAINYYERALSIQNHLKDKVNLGKIYNNLGNIYNTLGDYPKAIRLYRNGLEISEKVDYPELSLSSLNNIGLIYKVREEYDMALEYYLRALELAIEIDHKIQQAGTKSNIGAIYSLMEDFEIAENYFVESNAIYESLGRKANLSTGYHNIGINYKRRDNLPLAIEYLLKSLEINEQAGNKSGIALVKANLGGVYSKSGQLRKGEKLCNEALELAEQLQLASTEKNACECLYETYKLLGDGAKALVYLERANQIERNLQKEETTKQLERMEFQKIMLQDSIAKAEEARLIEQAHLEEVRKKNRSKNYALVGGLFFLLLAAGFYSRWKYVRKSRDIISKERDRSENLLLNILPAEIAAELKEKGRADARDFEMVSILFTDFKGFTEASAKLSAQDLVAEINTCFEAFDGIIAKYNIEKIKTIGDAYMAAGGLPVPTDDSVKNTVRAALEMQEYIKQRKQQKDKLGEPAFEMRVGIHTGPVVAGIVGIKKFQYDIWGDTVNTASRMESSGEVGKVNISESTYELVKDEFSFEERGEIEAKGKGKMRMYFVSEKLKVGE